MYYPFKTLRHSLSCKLSRFRRQLTARNWCMTTYSALPANFFTSNTYVLYLYDFTAY
jgi:hypothetical protein